MRINIKNRIRILPIVIGCSLLLFLLQGCIIDSDKVGDNLYTFKGNTVGSYLEKDTADCREFWKAIQRVGLNDLLKSYNIYTCFAPNDTAMRNYYRDKGVTSLNELPDSVVRYMVYSQLIPDKVYLSSDLVAGSLSDMNMNSRFLSVDYKAQDTIVSIVINSNSTIVKKDLKVENGVIHIINRVITPSTLGIPKLMGSDNRVSLFLKALIATGLSDSLQHPTKDNSYVPEINPMGIYSGEICRSPKLRLIGYTVFAESNEAYLAAGIDTTNLQGLTDYAKSVYDPMYPEDAGVIDVTNRRNSLNRFVAYHLIDKSIAYDKFFYKCNMASDAISFEFMETFCPNTIFEVSDENKGVIINNYTPQGVTGVTVLPVETGRLQNTESGYYYLLDKPLVYNQQVKSMLLNTRIRMDASSLHPELMTSGIRSEKGNNINGVTGDNNFYKFKDGYFKNVKFISPDTRLYYLQGQQSSNSWVNYQADEMMAEGTFDFILRLPPVPAGTYEVRFGYTANGNRGIFQFYLDDDNGTLQPQGIPLNMKLDATNPAIGWVGDDQTLDNGVEMDKMLRNRGYMKGGTTYLNGSAPARSFSAAIRRIICTQTWTHDGPHYLRFKNVSPNGFDQLQIDYFELVPTNIYNNPSGEPEDRL
jgi:uncharacterized surface protein with fasciclin (FAS1) repeats